MFQWAAYWTLHMLSFQNTFLTLSMQGKFLADDILKYFYFSEKTCLDI